RFVPLFIRNYSRHTNPKQMRVRALRDRRAGAELEVSSRPMNILLNLLDFIVLVLIVIHLLRRVSAGLANAPGAPILIICVALVAAIFATVSFTVYMGLVDAADSLMRVV